MAVVVRSRIEDGIGVLTLADRERGNVLSAELVDQASEAHRGFIERGVRVAILDAEGPAFCAGRDPEAVRVPGVPPAGAVFIEEIERSPVAWVAAVDAPVIGAGIHLVSTCMHVVAGPGARFRVPELLGGIYPRPVAAELARIIGARQTMRLLVTGDALTAQQAVDLGLVGEAASSADELAERALAAARALEGLGEELLRAAREGWRTRFGTAPIDGDG